MRMARISKLLFTPVDHELDFPANLLIESLRSLAWLGEVFPQGPASSFFIGADFFKYITFMGCAPAMRLEPQTENDLNFCFIHINTGQNEPLFRGHEAQFVPRCPACRHGLSDWQAELTRWQADHHATFSCPHCSAQLSIPQVNWREKAALGRCFIEVYSVYPHEGIPTPAFLSHLKTITGVEWKYFYEPA